jgi:competence protein ComEC
MLVKPVPVWKEAPFLRLIVPLIFGIVVQWYLPIPILLCFIISGLILILLVLFSSVKIFFQFRYYWLTGILINGIIFFAAAILVYSNDGIHYQNCIRNCYENDDVIIAKLDEPLSEKEKSFKAQATVESVIKNDSTYSAKGSIIIYFQKSDLLSQLDHGSQIIFKKPLQLIKNSGNPTAFDYQRYCAFQSIYYQVYLKTSDFVITRDKKENFIEKFLLYARAKTVSVFQKYLAPFVKIFPCKIFISNLHA